MNPMKKSLALLLSLLLLLSIFPLGAFATEEVEPVDTGPEEIITEEIVEEPAITEEPEPTPEATETPVANSLSEDEIVPVGVTAETSELPVEEEIVETESTQEDAAESTEDLTEADTPAEASDSTEEDAEETPATYGNIQIIPCASGSLNGVVITGKSGFASIARPYFYD